MSDKKNYYYNRELSWMDFNARVLEEAQKKDNPLMERLRFLAITGSNLDEFFMVRVAGVKSQIASNYTKPDDSGMIYRMKQNAVGLANICILSTMVLVVISMTVCMYVVLQIMSIAE